MEDYRILSLNLGSTSTKIAIFEGENIKLLQSLRHSQEEIKELKNMEENAEFRKTHIMDFLRQNDVDIKHFDAIVGRGGLLRPIHGGTYEVNDAMLEDLESCKYGSHVCNLGGIIAHEIATEIGVKAYVVDPPIVDELCELARYSGHPEFKRRTTWHALNQKAIAKRYAREIGKEYDELNLIVAHIGGGITVGAHQKGEVIDVNCGLDGEGPFTAERPGGLPVLEVLRVHHEGKYGGYEELKRMLTSRGGLVAYLGTNSCHEVVERIEKGDKEAESVYRAMAYQISKEIGAMATVLKGKVDAILLTGGIANDKLITGWISESVSYIAPVNIYPGEDEMTALNAGALRVLRGEEEVKYY